MNEANEFYENMRSKHQNVLAWRDGSSQEGGTTDTHSTSGKDLAPPETLSGMQTNGPLSPTAKTRDLTPNG